MFSNDFQQNQATKFSCNCCDYNTSRKSNYDEHILTAKHKLAMVSNIFSNDFQQNPTIIEAPIKYTCQQCNKTYKDNSGLWRHKKTCSSIEKKEIHKDELIITLLKQNAELIQGQQDMMMKLIENGTHNTTNTTNHTNSHNKAFNLNFFLNETCKDAMNIGEFVDSLKLQLVDLEKVGEAGYIEGITSIIVKNLKELDITKRPVHCTDKKRETVYIKDNNIWEKDEDKTQMHKLIKKVVAKNVKMFAKFREVHPDCTTYHSKYSDQYNKIIYESMGGKGDNDFEKNEKIIKNVLKQVIVDK